MTNEEFDKIFSVGDTVVTQDGSILDIKKIMSDGYFEATDEKGAACMVKKSLPIKKLTYTYKESSITPEIREGKVILHQSADDLGVGDGYCEIEIEKLPEGIIKLATDKFYFKNEKHLMDVIQIFRKANGDL